MPTRWAVLASVILWAAVAHAQSDLARAKKHYKAGAGHYQKGKYTDAIREFEESYRLSLRPDILYNLAQCHDKLGDLEKTVEYLRRYLRDKPKASDREQVSAWLASREKALADQRAAATRAAAERQEAERRAREAEAAARAARAAAVVTAPPAKARRSAAGWAVPAATAGVAVVLFAVGGAYGGIAMQKQDDAAANCGPGDVCTPEGVKQRSDAISAANFATGFIIAGGAALVAAGTLWFLLRPRTEAPVRVVAGVGPRGPALALQGVW